MKKNLIRLTESDLHKIVKESILEIINESVVTLNGKFATITYLELFDYSDYPNRFPYVVDYGDDIYYFPDSGKYQPTHSQSWKKKGFRSHKECIEFCNENDLEIVNEFNVGHSAAKGMPDTRAIKPNTHPKDLY